MCWINGEVQSRQPWKITIAEDMQDNESITKRLDWGGAGFGAQWGAGFVHGVAILHGFLQNPRFSRALVVASETTSRMRAWLLTTQKPTPPGVWAVAGCHQTGASRRR